ncbi:AAT-domain-containing protein [Thozetella sp. PMI_491]|nr:AAT-domain-containing protein [Thozetella sp. PMI_491]
MLDIHCTGTPYEIGYAQGSLGKEKVLGSIGFYKALFQKTCSLDWAAVTEEASKYVKPLEIMYPQYLEEMKGLAAGAGFDYHDILAVNVRTEINFGLFTEKKKDDIPVDGCTSLSWKAGNGTSFLSQNWDWYPEQAANLMVVRVSQPGTGIPDFAMVTEAGLLGKIGFNAAGVGCCLNAIKARGVDASKLPTHLALRVILESTSMQAAVEKIQSVGVAGSGHILVADSTGSTGLECTSRGIKLLTPDSSGRIVHSNHMLLEHAGIDAPPWLPDSFGRIKRMRRLVAEVKTESPTFDEIFELYKDQEGYPAAINRQAQGDITSSTLFNIIADLTQKKGTVRFGRPTEFTDEVSISF